MGIGEGVGYAKRAELGAQHLVTVLVTPCSLHPTADRRSTIHAAQVNHPCSARYAERMTDLDAVVVGTLRGSRDCRVS
jgi:hypothetical protein